MGAWNSSEHMAGRWRGSGAHNGVHLETRAAESWGNQITRQREGKQAAACAHRVSGARCDELMPIHLSPSEMMTAGQALPRL